VSGLGKRSHDGAAVGTLVVVVVVLPLSAPCHRPAARYRAARHRRRAACHPAAPCYRLAASCHLSPC